MTTTSTSDHGGAIVRKVPVDSCTEGQDIMGGARGCVRVLLTA